LVIFEYIYLRVDGIVDYTYNKENKNSIGHFSMHENRKNKPNKTRSGGDRNPLKSAFVKPTYVPIFMPKGCSMEIKHYKECVKNSNPAKCISQKISIMEICPKWVLEILREKKRIMMRATLIDNQTYRRAMEVSDYNKGRSMTDIKQLKTEEFGHPDKLRSDA
jgi:hypothetical protein